MEKELTSKMIVPTFRVDEMLSKTLNSGKARISEDWVHYIAPSVYNKVYYLVYQGMLRQFKIIKSVRFPLTRGWRFNNEHIHTLVLINIASVGETWVIANMWQYGLPFKVYKSVTNYEKGENLRWGVSSDAKHINEIYKSVCTFEKNGDIGGTSSPMRWYWSGTCAKPSELTNVPFYFIVDAKGLHFPNTALDAISDYDGYATKEECTDDNKVKVACFDDDESNLHEDKKVVGEFFGMKISLTKEQLMSVKEYINTLK